jgi:predicted TIM-barrel fold metal-dependent hydrolase
MIIDSLTHVTPDGSWFDTHHDASVGRLLREMDKASVDKAVVVALAGYIENEFVAKVCKQYSDRLIPGASLDPASYSSSKEAAQATKRMFANGEYEILKLHPRLNGYDPLDIRCLAILEEIASFSKPVYIWLDTLFRSNKCILKKAPIDTIHELAASFPDLKFVLLHSCGAQLLQLAELVSTFENLILDLSLTMLYYSPSSIQNDIDFLLTRRDCKLTIGSDFPEYTPSQYLNTLNKHSSGINLNNEKYNNIVGNNLLDILFPSLTKGTNNEYSRTDN